MVVHLCGELRGEKDRKEKGGREDNLDVIYKPLWEKLRVFSFFSFMELVRELK